QVIPRPANARRGDDAPWAGVPAERRRPSIDHVRRVLAAAPRPRRSALEGTGTRPSAVLAPIYPEGDEVLVVMTRRAQHLRSHRGEVSFPGGACDPDDADLRATAVREAFEEVRLDPGAVEIIGELDHLQTVTSQSYIVPFVGELPGRPALEASPAEVESILHVPLSELLADGVYHEERWGLPPLEHPVHFFELDGDVVWGATAAMLRNLLVWLTAD
ncbi:MAG TPA: CoA pyrophosphatase, partial [Acidimicrobiales bacterium]|nr:CoA pyrophosphatase [Acidimicrobiales bacterium]